MLFSTPITDIIKRRFSCRTYLDRPIAAETRQKLERFMSSLGPGPFGNRVRFQLLTVPPKRGRDAVAAPPNRGRDAVAASEEDRTALRGLGTYGFIRGATGFIVGAVQNGAMDAEDFGYRMEQVILFATDLGLGTCWLGGTFNRSRFAAQAGLHQDEQMPCVTAIGYISDKRSLMDRMIRRAAGSDHRLPWERLFFGKRFAQPITVEDAGPYATPLEMVRLAPSASNKQPWRLIQDGSAWYFYLQRTPGYRSARHVQVADLQRVDMGIAMCHFELTAREMGLQGRWIVQEPAITRPDELTEYRASWIGESLR